MESRSLDKALDIVACLITGSQISEKGENAALYQEYSTNVEVFDIVQLSLKKMNLNVYEYNNSLFVSPGDNNKVFGFSNEELRKLLGLKLNRELFLAYFIIYEIITQFYNDTLSSTYAEFIRLEDVIATVDKSVAAIADKKEGIFKDEVEANSFQQIAYTWEELPVATVEDQSGVRAARNSKSGFVKIIFNFLVSQELLVESQQRYYQTDRFKALIENYFDDYKGRFSQLLNGDKYNGS